MHDHDHDHGHDHGGHHERPASQSELRARALEALLVERGLVSTDAIDAVVSYYENDVGPQNGARVIARAWVDPEYKARLLSDGSAAIAEFGFGGIEGEHMVVVENTPSVHNVIVCTLCSCYPWPVLGLPPTWYKSYAYRARVVAEPRKVLGEIGSPARPRQRDAGAGLERRGALPRAAGASRGHRRPERGAARGARHAGRDDRRCARRGTGGREVVSIALAEVDAALGGYAPLPRLNGEFVFDEAGTAGRSAWASSYWSGWGCRGARSATTWRGDRAPRAARGGVARRGLLRRVPGRHRIPGGGAAQARGL